jgi:hypothetical protein
VPTPFAVPANNVVAQVGPSGYTAGSGTLALAAGQGGQFPALTGDQSYRLTVIQQAHAYDPLALPSQFTIYKATGRAGDTFTGLSAIEGTTDRAYVGGDVVDVRVTAGTLTDIQAAINNLETRNAALCQGRLTIISGDPTGSTAPSNQAPSSLLYFTPFRGNLIALYNGSTGWDTIPFAETSIAVPGPVGVYDLFAYNNGGTLALESSGAWTSTGNNVGVPGVRSQPLAFQDGIRVKSGTPTRRYLGTISSTGGLVSDTPTGRGVWNDSNRIRKKVAVSVGNFAWTYTLNGVWRALHNDGANAVAVVTGVQESPVDLKAAVNLQSPDGNNSGEVGIGYDSTTTNLADLNGLSGFVSGLRTQAWATLEHLPQIGLHTYYGLEIVVNTTGTVSMSFFSGGQSSLNSCGLAGTCWC